MAKKREDFTVADIKAIVPAMQPAWLRIVQQFNYVDTEDGKALQNPDGTDKLVWEWWDAVVEVLAYGSLGNGYGCYLIAEPGDGPNWIISEPEERLDTRYFLSVGERPAAGPDVPAVIYGTDYRCRNEEILPYCSVDDPDCPEGIFDGVTYIL